MIMPHLSVYFSLFILTVLGAEPPQGIDFESPIGIDIDYQDTIVWAPLDGKQKHLWPPAADKPTITVFSNGEKHALLSIPEPYRISLQDGVKEGARLCGGAAKLRKRDLIGCMINQAEAYARDDNVMELLDPRQVRKFKLQLRNGRQQLLELTRRFKELADLNRAMLYIAAAFETQTVGWVGGGLVLAGGAIIELGDMMTFIPVNDEGEQEEMPEPETTAAPEPTQTSSVCRPTGKDELPTDCHDEDCQGEKENKCTVGPEKDCPCTIYGRFITDEYDTEFGDAQQELFKKVYEFEPPAKTTKPPNPCETQTVEVPGHCGVPACQHVLAKNKGENALCGEDDYCFCDGVAVALLTSTKDGKTSLGCGYKTLPTKDACPSKTKLMAPSWQTMPAPAPSKTEAPPSSSSAPPKVNEPKYREKRCMRNSDCKEFTCKNGKKASCNYDIDPGAAWCRCG